MLHIVQHRHRPWSRPRSTPRAEKYIFSVRVVNSVLETIQDVANRRPIIPLGKWDDRSLAREGSGAAGRSLEAAPARSARTSSHGSNSGASEWPFLAARSNLAQQDGAPGEFQSAEADSHVAAPSLHVGASNESAGAAFSRPSGGNRGELIAGLSCS